jgi:mycothiol synthase
MSRASADPIVGVMPPIPGLVFRPFDRQRDYGAVAEVMSAANRHDGVDWLPTAESLEHEWEHNPGFDPDRDAFVAEVDGGLIGVVDEDWRQRGERVFHQLNPVVHPGWRHRGIGRVLLDWAERRALAGATAGEMGRMDLPHLLAGWADLEVPEAAPFAVAAGYEVHGYGVMMVRDLGLPIPEAPLPDGLEVRPVRPEDHRQIWDADCLAFQDHRDPAVRTEADFERWFTMPELDTGLWEVAWDGDEVAGSVWNHVFIEENERLGIRRGWLEHVSVGRRWRKRGLATALMTRSMRRLRDVGLTEAALGADAENLSGAIRLYESLGFRRTRTAANYRKALPLGPATL